MSFSRNAAETGWLPALRIYLATTALLNLIWEVLQLPLYTLWTTDSLGAQAFAVVHCTGGDVLIASLVLLAALVTVGSVGWPMERFRAVFVLTVLLGLGYTIYSEWHNVVVRKTWGYSTLMPVLPYLGTGLSPVLQWLVIPVVALTAARRQKFWPGR